MQRAPDTCLPDDDVGSFNLMQLNCAPSSPKCVNTSGDVISCYSTNVNMPEFGGIHACLVVGDRVLEEFDDPEYPFNPIYSHTRYVSAEDDQQFRVQITLRAGFDFCGADVVRCRLFLDDDTAPYWSTFTHPPANGIVRQDRTHFIATATRQDEATGSWNTMPFVFGGLTIGRTLLNTFACRMSV